MTSAAFVGDGAGEAEEMAERGEGWGFAWPTAPEETAGDEEDNETDEE